MERPQRTVRYADRPGPSGSWRVGDRERDDAVEALGEHFALGRLDRAEHDERTDRAYAARTAADLTSLFTDLPAPHGVPAPVAPQAPQAPRASGAPRAERTRPHHGPVLGVLLVVGVLLVLTHALWLVWLVALLWFGLGNHRHARRCPHRHGRSGRRR